MTEQQLVNYVTSFQKVLYASDYFRLVENNSPSFVIVSGNSMNDIESPQPSTVNKIQYPFLPPDSLKKVLFNGQKTPHTMLIDLDRDFIHTKDFENFYFSSQLIFYYFAINSVIEVMISDFLKEKNIILNKSPILKQLKNYYNNNNIKEKNRLYKQQCWKSIDKIRNFINDFKHDLNNFYSKQITLDIIDIKNELNDIQKIFNFLFK
jgi:hypothetical protein